MISPPKKLGKATARNRKSTAGRINAPPTFKKRTSDRLPEGINSEKESFDKNITNV